MNKADKIRKLADIFNKSNDSLKEAKDIIDELISFMEYQAKNYGKYKVNYDEIFVEETPNAVSLSENDRKGGNILKKIHKHDSEPYIIHILKTKGFIINKRYYMGRVNYTISVL